MRCKIWTEQAFLDKARKTCERSPDTYDEIQKVIDFHEVYPEISDLSIWAMRPLVRERNKEIQQAAVKAVKAKMAARSDIYSPNFSITRATLTGDQVREIVNEQQLLLEGTDIQREKLEARKDQKDKEVLYSCPSCGKLITVTLSKRDKIVSLRITEEADDAYAYLAKEFNIPRSKILSVLLGIRPKFPNLFKD
jgi:rubrerythrin